MKDECYEFIKNQIGKANIVGFGSYGQVKIARNTQSNQIVAIKLIHGKNAKQEIDVHHKLNHPNIIKLLNYYYEKDRNITYMVLEYAENGSLNQKIKFGLGQLSKQLIRKYFKNICQAIKYLHQNNYMHRDIKPENILITKDNVAKLCDFGFAAIFEARTTMCGTFQYMAPQMIKKKHYTYKIDIWALGILLFEMIQGLAPFRGETGQQVLAEMKRPIKFSQRFDSLQIDLIKKILRVSPQNRPSVDEILEHTYFRQLKEYNEVIRPIRTDITEIDETKSIGKVNQHSTNSAMKDKFNSSKQQLSQFFKNQQQQKATNPMQLSHIQKPRSPLLANYNSIKNQPNLNVPNFIQNNTQLNKSFKDTTNENKKQQSNKNNNERQSRKYSGNFCLHSPQNQKKTLSPAAGSKTQTKQDKTNQFLIKPQQQQQKKIFTSNWLVKNNNFSSENMKSKHSNTTDNNEQLDSSKKKTSITGKIGQHATTTTNSGNNNSYRFLNKSFKDLKTVDSVEDQKNKNFKTYTNKIEPHSDSLLGNSSVQNVRKNINISISGINSSFNQQNTRIQGQYQSPNSSFNIYPQSHQQNYGMKSLGSGEHHFSPPQIINFQKLSSGNITSHKQLNMSMVKEISK